MTGTIEGGRRRVALFEAPFHSLLAHGATTACSVIEERWERDVWAKADSVLAESRGKAPIRQERGPRSNSGRELANPFLMGQKSGFVPKKIYEKTPFEHSIGFRAPVPELHRKG